MTREFDARSTRYGRFFDEFEIGEIYNHWPGKTITESEDHLYCLLTMAGSPLHIDSNYAKTEMVDGKNLVVGTYIYALLTGMSVNDISGKPSRVWVLRSYSTYFPYSTGTPFMQVLRFLISVYLRANLLRGF